MPVADNFRRESPRDAGAREAMVDARIFSDVFRVVVVDEFALAELPIDGDNGKQQTERDEKLLPHQNCPGVKYLSRLPHAMPLKHGKTF